MLNETDLAHFTGAENFWRHPSGLVYTDGARHVFQKGEAYWLLDSIAYVSLILKEPFQVWTLVVSDGQGSLACDDGNNNALYASDLFFTDFPLAEIKFFLVDKTLMLPSEY